MSTIALDWAWKRKFNNSIKLTLMAMADQADDFGYCWYTQTMEKYLQHISNRTQVPLEDVVKNIDYLLKEKFIKTRLLYEKTIYILDIKSDDTYTD